MGGWAKTEEGKARQKAALDAGRAKREANRSQAPAGKPSRAKPGTYDEPAGGSRAAAKASAKPSRRAAEPSRRSSGSPSRASRPQPERKRGFLSGLFGGG
jgi:hypothetical protein